MYMITSNLNNHFKFYYKRAFIWLISWKFVTCASERALTWLTVLAFCYLC